MGVLVKINTQVVTSKVYKVDDGNVILDIPEEYLHEVTHSLIELVGHHEAQLMVDEIKAAYNVPA